MFYSSRQSRQWVEVPDTDQNFPLAGKAPGMRTRPICPSRACWHPRQRRAACTRYLMSSCHQTCYSSLPLYLPTGHSPCGKCRPHMQPTQPPPISPPPQCLASKPSCNAFVFVIWPPLVQEVEMRPNMAFMWQYGGSKQPEKHTTT